MVRAASLVLGLVLAACTRAPHDGIVFAVATSPTVLDPRLATDAASERVNALLYDRLVDLDPAGRPHPAMASWERITATRYRVRLQPGRATFWDGSLPHADDVAATYRSILDPALASPHAGALAHIARIEVIDDASVDFHLTRPDPLFPGRLTVGIVPSAALGARNLAHEPLGSGPLAFVRWREDGGLRLERRRDAVAITVAPVPDPTMRALKLLRGDADLLQNDLGSELYDYLAEQPGLNVDTRAGTTFAYLGFNLADPVLARREVRAAIAHAIDREAIIRHLFGGRAQPAESVLRPEHWAGARGLPPYVHDPARARELLRQAGYDEGHPLRLSYKTSTDPFRLRIAYALQAQLAQVGIELEVASYDWGTYFGDIKAGRFQLYSLAWVGVNSPDILRYAFASDALPPGGANRGRYRSARVDGLLAQAQQVDGEAAAALYAEVQRQVHEDLVYVPLWYESNVAIRRGVSGYAPGFDGGYQALNEVRIGDAGDG